MDDYARMHYARESLENEEAIKNLPFASDLYYLLNMFQSVISDKDNADYGYSEMNYEEAVNELLEAARDLAHEVNLHYGN